MKITFTRRFNFPSEGLTLRVQCPNSRYFGLEVVPFVGPLGPMYILGNYMDPLGGRARAPCETFNHREP